MPPNLVPLSSKSGKIRFSQSLSLGYAESYFPLAEQFTNQSDPAFCGVTTLCVILNAMALDPNVRWRGGWRWYGDDSMVLNNCCLSGERVRRGGINVEEFVSLGRCQGARIVLKRPPLPSPASDDDDEVDADDDGGGSGGAEMGGDGGGGGRDSYTLKQFRDDVRSMVRNPPPTAPSDERDRDDDLDTPFSVDDDDDDENDVERDAAEAGIGP